MKQHLRGLNLDPTLSDRLLKFSQRHHQSLQRKLDSLCSRSKWGQVGRDDLITNISSRDLTAEETEALSLGLKFDIGKDRRTPIDYFSANHRATNDVERGFAQGIVTAAVCLNRTSHPSLPLRYIETLTRLGEDRKLHITRADKGGGVIVMDKAEYTQKMMTILTDGDTYQPRPVGSGLREAASLKQRLRQLLSRSEQGKRLLHLLPENPRIPKAYGLPKTHKEGIPLRPIISGIGSTPHNLAKVLAKPLSKLLGTISGAHLRNSSDLLERLSNVGFRNKVMASFDVKSLFTNVPSDGAITAMKEILEETNDVELPLPRADFIVAVSMCVNFGSLEFNGEEFHQFDGLAMGSPLSPVLACMYMEQLEKKHYLQIAGKHSTWLRYVDDIILVTNQRCNLDNMLEKLNAVNRKIQFTVEREVNQELAFLDTLIHRRPEGPRFSVYRKPTNKDDFIHYFSGHSHRTKTGTVIGFFLRAYRICSEEFLEDELQYVINAFKKLAYPEGLLQVLREKARGILHRRNRKEEPTSKLILPRCEGLKVLEQHGTSVVHPTGKTILDLVRSKLPRSCNSADKKGLIYRIPCSVCTSAYIGETGRGLNVRVREHKRDLTLNNASNALVQHACHTGHYPNWTSAKSLHTAMDKKKRKMLEAAFIQTEPSAINTSPGFYIWAQAAAKLALNSLQCG